MGSITFLDGSGDITIHWTEEQNEQMLQVIEKKMKEGVVFFIVENFKGRDWTSKISSVQEITDKKITIHDQDITKLFSTGIIEVTKNTDEEIVTTGKATTPTEVIENNTVAVKRNYGG